MSVKPGSPLKKFLDVNKKKQTRVLGSVERHLIARPKDGSRRTDVLHPSDMVSEEWCHRASYYHLLGAVPVNTRVPSLRLESVFEEGHGIHAKWQRWFSEMGNLYGKWKCPECKATTYGVSYPECPSCSAPCTIYMEVPLHYEPLRIAGHSDGWLVGLGEPLMLEIKSIGIGTLRYEAFDLLKENNYDFEKAWKKLDAPFMKHIMQVQVYMKLAELIGYENVPQEAVLIYDAKPNQESKEFIVPKSDWGISHLFDAAKMIVEAVDAKTPPPCNITSMGCPRCKGYDND